MSYNRLIWRDLPDIAWPLDDVTQTSSTSNAINFISQTLTEYSASINTAASDVIDIPMINGGNTAIKLTSSSVAGLSIPLLNRFSERYSRRYSSLSFWLRCDKVTSGEITIAKKRNFDKIGLFLRENYLIFRYGTTSSYSEVSYGMNDLSLPTHIVLNTSPAGIEMLVNGESRKTDTKRFYLPLDASHSSNDFMDFYGHEQFNVIVDCPTIFPYLLNDVVAKRHFIYGLGKSTNENIFFSLAGDIYNMSTVDTQKSNYSYYDFPTDWSLIRYDNTVNSVDGGISIQSLPEPELYSFDNNVTKLSNTIRFSSSSNTVGSYISIPYISKIFERNEDFHFFAKMKLDGQLPQNGNIQTLVSYGDPPLNEALTIGILNNSGAYSLVMRAVESGETASIAFPTVSSSPIFYVGFKYDGISRLYLSMSGSLTQTASFDLQSASPTLDPMATRLPVSEDSQIRIGSRMLYGDTVLPTTTSSVNQFYGTFMKFIVVSSSINTSSYSSIDSYSQSQYSFTHNTSEDRFMVRAFGNANFIIHGPAIADTDSSSSVRISSNRIEFGYPDVVSGSQVKTYLTVYDYSDNVINSKTQLSKVNHIDWINQVDLSQKYLYFDIDIDAMDATRYPPLVKSFYMETYPYTASYTDIVDDGGQTIRIYSASNSRMYLPEMINTPTIVIKNDSGIRVARNYVDFQFSPAQKNYIMPVSGSLVLWLDARYMNGFFKTPNQDSSVLSSWKDLSASNVPVTSNSSEWPQYKDQSLNLLQLSHSLGGETASLRNISSSNSVVSVSDDVSDYGDYSFKIVPSGTSSNSFIYLGASAFNLLSEGILPNRTYTMLATIIMKKAQEASVLHANARRMVISASGTGTSDHISSQAPNQIGTHTVSATFTTLSNLIANNVRLYNGSASPSDIVYWDKIALYSGSVVSGSPVAWYGPYDHYNDRQTVRFYTSSAIMTASMSLKQPMTIYMVARSFGNGGWIGGATASAPSLYVESGSVTMCSGVKLRGAVNNDDFNLIVAVFNNNSSSLFVGNQSYSGAVGTGSYTSAGLTIGRSLISSTASSFLNGDISMISIYNSAHSRNTINDISNNIRDDFNVT